MPEMITLTQDKLEVVRGLVQDSVLTCVKLSAPDVYVAVITPKDTTNLLSDDDSTVEPRLTRVRLHLFRRNVDEHGPFSATINIVDAPPATHKSPDHTLAFAFHVPEGSPLVTAPVARTKRRRKQPAR